MPLTKGKKLARNLGEYAQRKVPTPPQEPSPVPTPQPSTPIVKVEAPPPEALVAQVGSVADILAPARPNTPLFSNHAPPPRELVRLIIPVLEERINPRHKSGVGHTKSKLNLLALKDLTSVAEFLRTYVAKEDITWRAAALNTARAKSLGNGHARTLCTWGCACLSDPFFIPRTSYGQSQDPLIQCDEFREELQVYLQAVGKYVTSTNVIQFTAQQDVQTVWGLTKAVSKTTAQRWMKDLQYRWRREPKGLYLDGHERPDVVNYRRDVYLKRWNEMEPRMQSYAIIEQYTYMDRIIRRIVVWFHDECTFFANDRRMLLWVLFSLSIKLGKKGEGKSLMVSDFVSAEYGWLHSPDGIERARELFQAGKNHDGYFSTSHVCKQVAHAADMLCNAYILRFEVFTKTP